MSIILPLKVTDISGNKVPGNNVMVSPRKSMGIAPANGSFLSRRLLYSRKKIEKL